MKKLFKGLFDALVLMSLLTVFGFWLGVGLFLGARAASLY